jgi:4-oxalomesaconate tautomerase
MGGATSLTSKVAIISPSKEKNADLDYLFLQVVIGKGQISTTQTCGNILAAVVPFAIESGLIKARHPLSTATVNMVNTGGLCEVTVETPKGVVNYYGETKVDGVSGTSASILCNYLNTEGATCGSLFPTGNVLDVVDGISVTCIDNGMPEILIRAKDLNVSGNES